MAQIILEEIKSGPYPNMTTIYKVKEKDIYLLFFWQSRTCDLFLG